jgi:hypothetical protein
MMWQAGSDVAWQAAGSEAGRRCDIHGNLSVVKEKFLSLDSELSTSVPKAGCEENCIHGGERVESHTGDSDTTGFQDGATIDRQ